MREPDSVTPRPPVVLEALVRDLVDDLGLTMDTDALPLGVKYVVLLFRADGKASWASNLKENPTLQEAVASWLALLRGAAPEVLQGSKPCPDCGDTEYHCAGCCPL